MFVELKRAERYSEIKKIENLPNVESKHVYDLRLTWRWQQYERDGHDNS